MRGSTAKLINRSVSVITQIPARAEAAGLPAPHRLSRRGMKRLWKSLSAKKRGRLRALLERALGPAAPGGLKVVA